MSLSSQLGTFVAVGIVYIVFTFAWAWYKGKQNLEEAEETDEENSTLNRGGH